MKYTISCVLLIVCMLPVAKACDVCGASSQGQGLGLLPQMNKHFAGMQYQYVELHSRHVPLSELKPVTYSNEYYRTAQLWGRYCIGDRWQIFAFVPYRFNGSTYNNGSTVAGIGDITVLANYILVQSDDREATRRHRLLAGGGLKLPTGRYSGTSEMDKKGLPNMQAGSGSLDIPLNVNYTLQYSKIGLNTDIGYTLTTASRTGYRYGNRLNMHVTCFYRMQYNKLVVIPLVGLRFEQAAHDYDNYPKRWVNKQSGGHIMSCSAGVQTYLERVGLYMQYNRPVMQNYANGNIMAVHRVEGGLMVLL